MVTRKKKQAAHQTPLTQQQKESMLLEIDGLVRNQAAWFQHKTRGKITADDFAQVARLECWRLLDRFDPSRGLKLTSYLGRRIVGAMQDHLRSFGYLLAGGQRIKRTERLVSIAVNDRMPKGPASQNITVLVDYRKPQPSRVVEHDAFEALLKDLTQQEKQCLRLYFREAMSMKQIGRTLDISESRVSQITGNAVKRLQRYYAAAN